MPFDPDYQSPLTRASSLLSSPGVEQLLKDVEKLSEETKVDEHTRFASSERRVVSDTGGAKGAKDVEFARLPDSIAEVARHFHDGSNKYADVAPGVANWSLGYEWSLSLNALYRHLDAWRRGDSIDDEFDRTHLAAVAFHALVLMDFEAKGIGTDDRYTSDAREKYLFEQRTA